MLSFTSWLYLVECIVIVTVNIITIVIFTQTSRLRKRKYILIVNLAVADLFVGLISTPWQIAIREVSHLYKAPIDGFLVQDGVFGAASLTGLAALAIERAHATFFPFRHHALTTRVYVAGITLVWFLAALNGLLLAIFLKNTSLYIILKISYTAMALCITATAYLLIIVNIRCQKTTDEISHLQNKRLTKTLAVTTMISIIAWIPYQLLLMYLLVGDTTIYSDKLFWQFRRYLKVLHYSNSLANFFVYAFRMNDFKSELISRFRSLTRRRVTTRNESCTGHVNQVTTTNL